MKTSLTWVCLATGALALAVASVPTFASPPSGEPRTNVVARTDGPPTPVVHPPPVPRPNGPPTSTPTHMPPSPTHTPTVPGHVYV